MFFLTFLVSASLIDTRNDIKKSKGIINNTSNIDITKMDIAIGADSKSCIPFSFKLNDITDEIVDGYIINDNINISINKIATNVIDNFITIKNSYLKEYLGKQIIVHNLDSPYIYDTAYQVIPTHTYEALKNTDELNNKIFVLDVNYDILNNELKDSIDKISSISVTDSNLQTNLNYTLDNAGNVIQKKSQKFYFKIVDDDEFNAYAKIYNLNNGVTSPSDKMSK